MMSRGAKTPSQLEEKLAFKNESEDFRNELRRAMGYDDKYIRSDEQAEIYEHCAQMSSNLYHAPSAPTKIKQLKARKAKKDVSEHYYEYYDD